VRNQEPIKKREEFAVSLRASKKREMLQTRRKPDYYKQFGSSG